ncbi:MAG: GNAT family N-acetyltransferase [Beijerinckiaceae bacterium]
MTATPSSVVLRQLDADAAQAHLPALAALLVDAVANGASVNFMAGFSLPESTIYWQKQIDGLSKGDRVWIAAEDNGQLVGTVMCVFFGQPNQPFRAEVSKMIVHSSQRRRGVGAMLMAGIEAAALAAGKTHLLLDTETGSAGDRLYRRMGWHELGTLPDVAYTPDGSLAAATVFYKQLAPAPVWNALAR